MSKLAASGELTAIYVEKIERPILVGGGGDYLVAWVSVPPDFPDFRLNVAAEINPKGVLFFLMGFSSGRHSGFVTKCRREN